MVVNIEFEEASSLIHELHKAVPEERRAEFSDRVRRITALLYHPPTLDADVLVSLGSDSALEGAIPLGNVVLPL